MELTDDICDGIKDKAKRPSVISDLEHTTGTVLTEGVLDVASLVLNTLIAEHPYDDTLIVDFFDQLEGTWTSTTCDDGGPGYGTDYTDLFLLGYFSRNKGCEAMDLFGKGKHDYLNWARSTSNGYRALSWLAPWVKTQSQSSFKYDDPYEAALRHLITSQDADALKAFQIAPHIWKWGYEFHYGAIAVGDMLRREGYNDEHLPLLVNMACGMVVAHACTAEYTYKVPFEVLHDQIRYEDDVDIQKCLEMIIHGLFVKLSINPSKDKAELAARFMDALLVKNKEVPLPFRLLYPLTALALPVLSAHIKRSTVDGGGTLVIIHADEKEEGKKTEEKKKKKRTFKLTEDELAAVVAKVCKQMKEG